MEAQHSPFRHRPSVEPTNIETAVMAIVDSHEDLDHEDRENETPIFREPNWSSSEPTPVESSTRPVLLQPTTGEARMKQHDKDIVARLARGSSSSESESPVSSESRRRPSQEKEFPDLIEEEQHPDQSPQKPLQHPHMPPQTFPSLPQPQQYRALHQQKRPAPLTLNSIRPLSSPQPPRLPSLARLVPSSDPKRNQIPQTNHQVHRQQDRRRLSRVSKPAIISPSTYGPFTPIQVVPSWQGIPYGWTPVSVPFQVPVQAPVASPRHIFSPQGQRTHGLAQKKHLPQQQQPQQESQPKAASTATGTSAPSPSPQLRQDLWKVGGQYLCNPGTADAYVRAVEIRYGSTTSASPGVGTAHDDEMDVDAGSEDSPSTSSGIPANPFGNSLLLRIVIHSSGRSSVAMTREFDRQKLQETIPDLARSPRSPRSGTSSAGTVAISSTIKSTPDSAISSLSLARGRKSQIRAQQASTPSSPVSASPIRRLTMPPVPIHLPYARAHTPALAAVLLLRETHKGDIVDLPVPFPGAWLETSGYMYTGNEDLLNERVKQNLWYLGGAPTSNSKGDWE